MDRLTNISSRHNLLVKLNDLTRATLDRLYGQNLEKSSAEINREVGDIIAVMDTATSNSRIKNYKLYELSLDKLVRPSRTIYLLRTLYSTNPCE